MSENKITNKMLSEIRPELDAAVAEVAKKYGVTIRSSHDTIKKALNGSTGQ